MHIQGLKHSIEKLYIIRSDNLISERTAFLFNSSSYPGKLACLTIYNNIVDIFETLIKFYVVFENIYLSSRFIHTIAHSSATCPKNIFTAYPSDILSHNLTEEDFDSRTKSCIALRMIYAYCFWSQRVLVDCHFLFQET